jgi:hypothetical protein
MTDQSSEPMVSDFDEERDFDPTQEGGGDPCERCGVRQEPWRYSRLCQGCIWDDQAARKV